MIWFSNYILGDFPNYGEFGGTINLIESANGKIYKISDSGIRPNSNIIYGLGDTVWIDYSEVEGPQIWAADIQSCIGIDEATNECVKPMWSIQGKWPNTYNNLENNNVACPN